MNRQPRIYSTNISGCCMSNFMGSDENKAIDQALAHAYIAWSWLGWKRVHGGRMGEFGPLSDYRPGVEIYRQQEGADGYHAPTEVILFSGPDPQPGRAPTDPYQTVVCEA